MKKAILVLVTLPILAFAFSGCLAAKSGGAVTGDAQRISGDFYTASSLRAAFEGSFISGSGCDKGVYEMLIDALLTELKQIENAGGDGRAASFYNPEYGETDLQYDVETGVLSWRYTLAGDYDLSGEVGIPDITPIALNYGAKVGDGEGDDDLEAWIDGDGDGIIGVPDVTIIARNFGKQNYGSRVLTVAYLDDFDGVIPMDFLFSRAASEVTFPPGGWTEIAAFAPANVLLSANPHYEIQLPAGTKRFVCVEKRDKWGYSLSSWPIDLLTPDEEKISVQTFAGFGKWKDRDVYKGRIAVTLKNAFEDERTQDFVSVSGITVDRVLPDGVTIGASLPAEISVEQAVETFSSAYPDAVESAEPSPVIWWWS